MPVVYIALGSNLGDRNANMIQAIHHIERLYSTTIVATSRFLETKPLDNLDSPLFINAMVKIETQLSPEKLLSELLSIEKRMGPIRKKKWESRIIDLDIIFYGTMTLHKK